MSVRPRVLFVSNNLQPKRGGDAVAAWMLQALASRYEVTILTWAEPDWAALDRRFGTALAGGRFAVRTPSAMVRWLIGRIPDDSDFQAANYLLRCARQMGREFAAVVVSSSLEADVGRPCLQYLHYPYLGAKRHLFGTAGDAPLLEKVRALRQGRLRPWMLISGYSFARMRRNLTLTNSEWTRGEIRKAFEMDSRVVYPPAPGGDALVPWQEREDGFVVVGWFEPTKRQDWIIETLSLVRSEWPGLRLHVCGPRLRNPYAERVARVAAAQADWVTMHYDLPSEELLALVSRQRYGMHGMIAEHFGIAPATFVRAGCIPFVHGSGGQVEIVNGDSRLCYEGRDDAVRKVLAVLSDEDLQRRLRPALLARSAQFSPERFMKGVLDAVAEMVAQA